MPTRHPRLSQNPGAHWYLVGAVLIVMGPIALVWSLFAGASALTAGNQRFTAPGGATVRTSAPGEFSLWRVLEEGASPAIPDGIRITITEPTLGGEYELEPIPGVAERIGDIQRIEIARTSLPTPGPIEVYVEGHFDPGEFQFGPSTGPGLAGGGLVGPSIASNLSGGIYSVGTLLFGSLSIVGMILGVTVIVVVWVARDRSGRMDDEPDDQLQD